MDQASPSWGLVQFQCKSIKAEWPCVLPRIDRRSYPDEERGSESALRSFNTSGGVLGSKLIWQFLRGLAIQFEAFGKLPDMLRLPSTLSWLRMPRHFSIQFRFRRYLKSLSRQAGLSYISLIFRTTFFSLFLTKSLKRMG
jgi:hypothetical protein